MTTHSLIVVQLEVDNQARKYRRLWGKPSPFHYRHQLMYS